MTTKNKTEQVGQAAALPEADQGGESVIHRRRADDWKKPTSITHHDVAGWREGDGVAFVDDRGVARIGAALSGASTIAALLMQASVDRDSEGQESGLRLCGQTERGLLEALASCIELAEQHTVQSGGMWTTSLMDDDPEADYMRAAAHQAKISREARRESEMVKYRAEQAARAAGKGAA